MLSQHTSWKVLLLMEALAVLATGSAGAAELPEATLSGRLDKGDNPI